MSSGSTAENQNQSVKKFMRIVQQVVKSINIRKKDIKFDFDPISEYFSLGFSA